VPPRHASYVWHVATRSPPLAHPSRPLLLRPLRARSLVITGAEMLGVTPAAALELYGRFFVRYVYKQARARHANARRRRF
jgi:hypothetical protein